MPIPSTVTPELLATEFSRLLRANLGRDAMAEINRCNAASNNSKVCHSHDFIDANVVMLDALVNLNCGSEFEPESAEDCAVWDAAWNLAKTNKFYAQT